MLKITKPYGNVAKRVQNSNFPTFSTLPTWAQFIVGTILFLTAIILWLIFWDFIGPSTKKLVLYPLTYIIVLAIHAGITLFSGFHLVKVTVGMLREIPTKFGETKMKEVPGLIPGLIVYLFVYTFWVFFTLGFLAMTVQWILEPFGISLQSLGILPTLYPGYFVDHPVYIFGYKVIPIID